MQKHFVKTYNFRTSPVILSLWLKKRRMPNRKLVPIPPMKFHLFSIDVYDEQIKELFANISTN